MKGLETMFANALANEAEKRGFVVADNMGVPILGETPYYRNADYIIGSSMVTMFPDTTVTIMGTPRHPNATSSKQQLLRCDATWMNETEKWSLQNRLYTNEELVSFAFDQMLSLPIGG